MLPVVPHRRNCAGGVSGNYGFEVHQPCFLGTHEVRAAELPDQALLQADEEGAPHTW